MIEYLHCPPIIFALPVRTHLGWLNWPHEELVKARDAALAALHAYADELEKRVPKMVDFTPMGETNYNYYLKHA